MDKNFETFNTYFPNSKYRLIGEYYHPVDDSPEELSKYQKNKKPIDTKIYRYDDSIKSFIEIDNEKAKENLKIISTDNFNYRIGWIVSDNFIVVDVDNKKSASKLYTLLTAKNINFAYNTSKKGGHFTFADLKDENLKMKQGSDFVTACGLRVDTRCSNKGYIILPTNDPDRKWGNITNEVDTIPYFIKPLKNKKMFENYNFIDMKTGGRNDLLIKYLLALKDYAPELTVQEKTEIIRIINDFIFAEALSNDELDNTVLREENINKLQDAEDDDNKSAWVLEEALARKITEENNIIYTNEEFYMYTGKYYRKISKEELERLIHNSYRKDLKQKNRSETISFIKMKTGVDGNLLDKDWSKIVFNNGILNLSNMKLMEHTPDEYNTVFINHNYINDAPHSKSIDEFMTTMSNYDEEVKRLLYELIGYCFIRRDVFSKFFIIIGGGGTGKSTYLDVIQRVVGLENASFQSLHSLQNQFAPANLHRKLVNLGDDISATSVQESDILKKLSSGQMFAADKKYVQETVNFQNYAKLIFTANELPPFNDRTTGLYRRFLPILIDKKIEKPDPFFLQKLTSTDYEYLIYKSVLYLIEAMGKGTLTIPKSSQELIDNFITNQSSVISFLKDTGRYSAKALTEKKTPVKPLYDEYVEYCDEAGFKALKRVRFKQEIFRDLKIKETCTTFEGENNCWRFVRE